MKEKILPILEKAVKNSTFSERTFSEVADAMAKAATTAGITDDKLEAFVNDMLPMFNTFQGDVNNQISEAVKKVKPSKKEDGKTEEPKKEEKNDPDKPLTSKDIAAIVAEANKPLMEKINGFETSSKRSAIAQDVKKQLMSQYKIKSELCDKIIGRIEITPESTVEDIAKNALQEYNELASNFGLQEATTEIPGSDRTPPPPDVKDIDAILDKMT
ncbi:hypothetical protein M2132_001068 [Dysgonomonas sp. PH5-45]|uniref:hypothetical protein n=1 Tax=unclassified Dysgonomonas TaxID=2630389 RepID=UPI002475CCE0|nr:MULTISPECIES: hypothetical protein [unclassified Dysgonomonas]MDH6354739.1 hypothetical protein [Dysgonomonas sp. PH5-45]MDH6387638.1 hypothetical protein [Dysgonomonas sp. PH5-37]